MWHLDHEIEAWFEKIKIKRDEKYNPDSKDRDNRYDTYPDGTPMFEENDEYNTFLEQMRS